MQIEIGGALLAEFEVPSSELLGLAFAIIVLILAFGSVLAMGLPIGIALAGIGVGTILAGLLSHVLSIPDFATTVAVMLGLGVGIDYALFIVTRYRENLHKGASVEEATVVALDTAGRAVAFAATTVVISLLGMLLMGLSFITGLAGAAAVVVAVTAVASLTLLPALLGFAGERVEVTRWRGLIAALLVAVGLAGVALAFPPLALVGLALAAVVLVASFAVAPLRREVPRRRQRPLQETVAIPVEPGDPAAPRGRGARRRGDPARAGDPVLQPAHGVQRRGQLPGGDDHAPGLRPARAGLRPGLQRTDAARHRGPRRHRRPRRSRASPRPWPPTRGWPS